MATGDEISRAPGDQPPDQHDRLVPPRAVLRKSDRRNGYEPAKYWSASAALSDQPGYVSCRRHPADLLLPGNHRNPDFRSPPRLVGSAHPHGKELKMNGIENNVLQPEGHNQPQITEADALVDTEELLITTQEEERISVASNWKLVWWRFRKNKLAVISAILLLFFSIVVLVPDFFSTHDPEATNARLAFIPIQNIHLIDEGRL